MDLKRFSPENLAKDTLFNSSVSMDWHEIYEQSFETHSELNIITPSIDRRVLDEHFPDWENEYPESDYDNESERLEAARDAFETTSEYYEWKDSYFPMMNFGWPIDLRYGADTEEIATLIENLAGCVSLVEYDDEYFLALSGGGMDLSWEICLAFIACGCIPPLRLLRDLPKMAGSGKYQSNVDDAKTELVLACFESARDVLRQSADQLNQSEFLR